MHSRGVVNQAWAHNPVALLSVCLLAQAHEHAAELVLNFGQLEMSVPFLVQIDRLVQLLESPILTHVRLQLLEPEAHPHLLKALWGIVMLLPQSPAYHTLKNRLSAVPEIGLLRLQLVQHGDGSGHAVADGRRAGIDFGALLKTYDQVQSLHESVRRQKQRRRAESTRLMQVGSTAAATNLLSSLAESESTVE